MVELLVVLAIIAIMSSVASVAFRRAELSSSRDSAVEVLAIRREAIAAGHSITRLVRRDSTTFVVTALADGRVVADSALGIDPSTGVRHATAP
jgi:type II secretory pathway pseudopilin PulG